MAWFTEGYAETTRSTDYWLRDVYQFSNFKKLYCITDKYNTDPPSTTPNYWLAGIVEHGTTADVDLTEYNKTSGAVEGHATYHYTTDYTLGGSVDERVGGYWHTNLPIFKTNDQTSIDNYLNNGDWSGAINAEDLREKLYAQWTIAYTNAENTNYSIAVDCPQFYDSNSEFYGKANTATIHLEVKQAGLIYDPFYKNDIAYGTTWNATLQSLLYNSDSTIGTKLLEKVMALIDADNIQFDFWVSFYDSNRESEVTSAHGFAVLDHASVEDYGFITEEHGDTITFKAGVVLDDSDSDVSNNDVPEETSDTTDSESVANVTSGNLLTRTYALTSQETQGIGAFLWGASFMQNILLLNTSPIENIVTCKLFPFELGGADKNVYIGNVDSGTQAKQVDSTVVKFESDLYTIPLYYSNRADNLKFLDYAPYTKVELFLPFIGLKEIPSDLCIGKTIKLVWLIDLVTGTLQTDVYIDGKCLMIFNSQIGVDIPLTAQNLAQVQSAYIQNAIGGGVSLASGNPMGAVSALLSSATTQYHSQSSGTPSPATALHGKFEPYVIITRPTAKTVGDVKEKDNTISHCKMYKKVMGAPCYEVEPLGNFEGYTEVENPRVSVDGALKVEIDEINRLLDLGVIMPYK